MNYDQIGTGSEQAYDLAVDQYESSIRLAEQDYYAKGKELIEILLKNTKVDVEASLKTHTERLKGLREGKGYGDLAKTEARIARLNELLKRIRTLEGTIYPPESSYTSFMSPSA